MIIFRFTDYSEARGLGTDNLLYAINVFVQKRNLIDPCSTTMIWLCSEDVQIYINTYLIMRALWLAGKTDLILCRDLITDVMGMYSMARYVILASAMHLNVLKQFDKLSKDPRLVVFFFTFCTLLSGGECSTNDAVLQLSQYAQRLNSCLVSISCICIIQFINTLHLALIFE